MIQQARAANNDLDMSPLKRRHIGEGHLFPNYKVTFEGDSRWWADLTRDKSAPYLLLYDLERHGFALIVGQFLSEDETKLFGGGWINLGTIVPHSSEGYHLDFYPSLSEYSEELCIENHELILLSIYQVSPNIYYMDIETGFYQ